MASGQYGLGFGLGHAGLVGLGESFGPLFFWMGFEVVWIFGLGQLGSIGKDKKNEKQHTK